MNILLLMSGSSNAFQEAGYPYPKNLVEIDGLPLVQQVLDSLSSLQQFDSQIICMIRREENRQHHTGTVINLLAPNAIVREVHGVTAGAACTALLAIEYINNDEPLAIINGDQIIETNLAATLSDFQYRNLDGGIVVFEAVHPRWSYVRCNSEGLVVETAEKRPISKLATAGFYYFSQGKYFVNSVMEMIKKDDQIGGNFYVCPTYNQMLLKQAKIGIHKIPREAYFSLATPQCVMAYEDHLRILSTQRGVSMTTSHHTITNTEHLKLLSSQRG